MELDITTLFKSLVGGSARYRSGSIAELGPTAARDTWEQCLEDAEESPILLTPESLEAVRQYAKSFGAWGAEEIASWSDDELNAFAIQEIAHAIRQFEDYAESDWDEWEIGCEEGRFTGNLYPSGEKVFYSFSA